jgi:type IV pilus assembly protein PilX
MNISGPGRLSRSSQRGAALVVSLILLLVLTILGVTAMNSSILQGFMASSYQQQTQTLAGAENVLLEGEWDVEDLVQTGVDGRTYYYNLFRPVNPDVQFPVTVLDQAWPDNEFVIEYMGEFQIPGESVAIGSGFEDSVVHIFRVSARERRTDDERGALRIVQSLYVTLAGPDE